MPVQFDVKITDKDMYRFNMYHAYTGFQGIFATLIGLAVLVVAFVTMGNVGVTYTILYYLFGVVFLVYTPVNLWLRSKRQFLVSPVLKEPMHYTLNDEGIRVRIGQQEAVLEWNMVYRMVSTKSNLLIYSNRIHAYVIPRSQLGEQFGAVKELAEEKLETFRVKLK